MRCGSTGTRAENKERRRSQRGYYYRQQRATRLLLQAAKGPHDSPLPQIQEHHPKATEQYSQIEVAQKLRNSHS